ncbi:HEAT repeat domain-containing protein [Anaerobacillus alkaliphilus]|uniref:HEAT repeat domain-containing protein n=1 Tax=Anaerobacillus alkaliphilus TaxID=1548597 RepID=A0A4Q0W1F6_9BACI|nr:HEAT repeat domain-containing protein [Anaerobacillus alkaliphilus]RXJ04441.1 HEAT repeat domain-containing protein [Anaerobacillus alkaliphilus]
MYELLLEIKTFRDWAITADQSFGEWETEYFHWDKIYHFASQLIENIAVERWSSELLNEFLYILARDNECEIIIDTLIENPHQLLSIAEHSVSFPDHDTRWQIAYGLGEIKENGQEIKKLLKKFLYDEEEYVRRRATFSLGKKGLKL